MLLLFVVHNNYMKYFAKKNQSGSQLRFTIQLIEPSKAYYKKCVLWRDEKQEIIKS